MGPEYGFGVDNLATWRPLGTLDTAKITEFIRWLDEVSKQTDPLFSRFIDLTRIAGISIHYSDLAPLAESRNSYHETHSSRKVKMGFLVNNPLAYGMARMYQSLIGDDFIEAFVSESAEEVARFLNVDRSALEG